MPARFFVRGQNALGVWKRPQIAGTKRLLAPVLAMLVLSCERRTVREYQAPKETFPKNSMLDAQIEQTSARTFGVHLRTPPSWKAQPPTPLRKASFVVEAEDGSMVDISVTSFPDESGGLLANINRWRGQLGLGSIAAELLEQTIERRTLAGRDVVIVDIADEPVSARNKQRIIGAILSARGETWFFKMMGDDALTAAQKPSFFEVLDSIQFRGP